MFYKSNEGFNGGIFLSTYCGPLKTTPNFPSTSNSKVYHKTIRRVSFQVHVLSFSQNYTIIVLCMYIDLHISPKAWQFVSDMIY